MSSESLSENDPCVHARGRQPIGVNQPNGGGTDYPLINPSQDIEYLLADFYLSYEDDQCLLTPPFKLAWLYGFGDIDSPAIKHAPTPEHGHDILITDANDEVVFDSTRATGYTTLTWGNGRLLIIQWRDLDNDTVCRCVKHLCWTQHDIDDGLSRGYAMHLAPQSAILDPRTLNKLPRRLRSIFIGALQVRNKVIFENGYNVSITKEEEDEDFAIPGLDLDELASTSKTVIPGSRLTTSLRFQAGPGLGLGRVPGCEEEDPPVRSIAGVRPDDSGNIVVDLAECLRLQRPVGLISYDPRQFDYAILGYTHEEAKSMIELHNDCGVCCDCDYYVRTYKGLKRQWYLGDALADRSEDVRDTLRRNIERWEAARQCRQEHSIRAVLIPEPDCKIVPGGIYCNNHKCCIAPLVLRFTLKVYYKGALLEDSDVTIDCRDLLVAGSAAPIEGQKAALAGKWPVYDVTFDYSDPLNNSSAGFRLCLPYCTPDYSMKLILSAHYPELLPTHDGTTCVTPEVETPAELEAIWAASELGLPKWPIRAMVETPIVPLNNNNAYCTCVCPRGEEEETVSESI